MKGLEKFEELVACFEKLPGVGKKSALRYAYFVAMDDTFSGLNLANSIEESVRFLKKCSRCGGLSEDEICDICSNPERDNAKLCIVESAKDILVIEKNGIYDGLYFVLEKITDEIISKLKKTLNENSTIEIIFALTPGINSDGTILYIEDLLKDYNIQITKIAQGIPTGVTLENVDSLSLTKALNGRIKI